MLPECDAVCDAVCEGEKVTEALALSLAIVLEGVADAAFVVEPKRDLVPQEDADELQDGESDGESDSDPVLVGEPRGVVDAL